PIPDSESKHSDEAPNRFHSPQGIRLQHDLRVARAFELNAVRCELGPDFLEVIDFAVEYGRVATVRRNHRLVSGATQIQDRKSTMAKTQRLSVASVFPRAVVIRPAMGQALQPKF